MSLTLRLRKACNFSVGTMPPKVSRDATMLISWPTSQLAAGQSGQPASHPNRPTQQSTGLGRARTYMDPRKGLPTIGTRSLERLASRLRALAASPRFARTARGAEGSATADEEPPALLAPGVREREVRGVGRLHLRDPDASPRAAPSLPGSASFRLASPPLIAPFGYGAGSPLSALTRLALLRGET